ncbi:DnaJ domain-containing protein [Candidatus Vidania fulgoroideorum]
MLSKYYKILGLNENASLHEVKKAYRRLAMKYHPDRNKEENSEKKFKEVKEAYERIINKNNVNDDLRNEEEYEDSQKYGGEGGSSEFDDIFRNFFGGGSYEYEYIKEKVYKVNIEILQGFNGYRQQIEVQYWEVCNHCKGNKYISNSDRIKCTQCDGLGYIIKISGFFNIKQKCGLCKGTGFIVFRHCKKCKGLGKTKENKKIYIDIPRGIASGTRFKVEDIRDLVDLENKLYSEIYIEVYIKNSKLLKLDKNGDLHYRLEVFFIDALLGKEETIKPLNDLVKVKLPECTRNEDIIFIPNEGYILINKNTRTNLYVHVIIKTPLKINKEQKLILKKLKESFSE